jgi:hypothetical protein
MKPKTTTPLKKNHPFRRCQSSRQHVPLDMRAEGEDTIVEKGD